MKMTTTMNQTTNPIPIIEQDTIKNRLHYFSSSATAFTTASTVDDNKQQYYQIKKMQMKNSNSIFTSSSSTSSSSSSSSSTIRDNETIIHMIQGYTKEVEDDSYQKSRKHVCCLWNHVPEQITLYEDQRSASYRFVMTIDELCSVAKQEMTDSKY